jgi:type IV pilus assembly protein PilM
LGISQRIGWIGVDVGTHTVKLAQVVRDGATARLHRAAVIQRPASWNGEESLALEQPITSHLEIRAALECGDFVGRDAICVLPMNACQLRCLNVPPGSERERRTIIEGEMAEEWSELRHPMEFDFWEMETSRGDKAGGDTFNVSVLAASRLWISQLFRDCRKSGLNCWAVDGAPLAMARAVGLAGGASAGRRALAVDWGYSSVTLSIVGDDRPLYSRRVHDCAFGRVLEALMNAFDVTLDEAQHLVDSQGLPHDESKSNEDAATQQAIAEAAAEPLEELVSQIRRTLHFTEAQRRHLQPTAVWLLGGGAAMRNAAPYLHHQLELPVHIWGLPEDDEPIACAAGQRAAVFSAATALSAAVWRAA